MGPVFSFPQYVKVPDPGAPTRPRLDEERIAQLLQDGGRQAFESHPDIQDVVAMLVRWYGDS